MGTLFSTFNDMQLRRHLESAASACPANDNGDAPTGMIDALEQMALLARGDRPTITALRKGASSEIYRVKLAWGTICIKRSLPRPSSSGDTALPVQRSNFEGKWLRIARDVLGESVPAVLGEQHGMFAMEYLDPARHTSWATQLHSGDINPSTAAEIGRMIGRVHAATANNFAVAQRFSTDRIFHAARIEPLLLTTAAIEPEAGSRLKQLALNTERTKLALIHGDFSPDNMLIGPKGPVLLDAECAWYGDPAFDLALFLSYLLVACVLQPQWCNHYLTCYTACSAAYAQRVTWERPEHTDERAALLVPALVLARAGGHVPSDSLQPARDRERAAVLARTLLLDPVLRLGAVREAWRRGMTPG